MKYGGRLPSAWGERVMTAEYRPVKNGKD